MTNNIALTYDDIQLIPFYSEVEHRNKISLKTKLSTNYELMIPLVASPMDTVCEHEMAFKMFQLGGVGCIHRFMAIEEQVDEIKKLKNLIDNSSYNPFVNEQNIPIMASVGSNGDFLERSKSLIESGVNVILIDVAHGHHINVKKAIEEIKGLNLGVDIIAGNIATSEAAIDLQNWGADGLRCGIGGGCFTPNMKVKTSEGYIDIIDIKIGDEVYSHNGELNKVLNKLEFDRNEEIIIINDIECTKNHEFYVVNIKYEGLVNSSNIEKYAEWIPAGNLTDKYFLVEI